MVTGKSVLTALTVGALAGSLYAMWITVASARDQAPSLPLPTTSAGPSPAVPPWARTAAQHFASAIGRER